VSICVCSFFLSYLSVKFQSKKFFFTGNLSVLRCIDTAVNSLSVRTCCVRTKYLLNRRRLAWNNVYLNVVGVVTVILRVFVYFHVVVVYILYVNNEYSKKQTI
jgi:hypothetical protein